MAEQDRADEVKNAQVFDSPPLQLSQKVICQDGYVGKVVALRLNSERKYQSFVVETGFVFRHRYIVPSAWVDRIESDRVYLSAKKDDLKALPKVRPDPILVFEVKHALREEKILHGAEIRGIHVSARRGTISLNGFVPDPAQQARAEEAARQIPGVLRVENQLVVDEDLKLAAAAAIAEIPDRTTERIFVGAESGFITITGEVASVESSWAAEERAGRVPQIRGVLNRIRVSGLEFPEARPLQPRIGAKVYGRHIVSGHVEQVIVNSVNRLVTGMVVDGLYPEPKGNRKHWFLGDSALVRRKVVIPIHSVEHQTKNAVFLENEARRFEDFNPTSFSVPDANWQPPYPYHRNHVLLYHPVGQEEGNPESIGVNQIRNAIA